MHCWYCTEVQHIYRGSNARGEWECTSCGSTTQVPPGAYEIGPSLDEMAQYHERELFEQVMDQLYEDGELQK